MSLFKDRTPPTVDEMVQEHVSILNEYNVAMDDLRLRVDDRRADIEARMSSLENQDRVLQALKERMSA